MGNFLIAWLVGMSLSIFYQSTARINPFPPKPGKLAVASGIYVMLAVLAEVDSMRTTATLLAWGYNVSIGLKIASDYQSGKIGNPKQPVFFWKPPIAPDDSLFPTGKVNGPNTAPAGLNATPGNPSAGPVVA